MRALLCSFSRVVLPACLTLAPFLVQAQERWPVATRPTLDIFGELSPDGAVLAMPIAATLTSSGHLIVIDALENRLLVLDRAGRFVHRLGREGGGPGEFRGISWSGHCGSDSVAVWDRRGGRLVYVDGEGKLLGQVPVPFSPPVAGRTASTACSRTGTFALLSLPEVTPQGAIVRGPATLTLYDAEAGERPFPASVTSSEFVIMRGGGSPRPLGRQTHVALDDRHVFVGTADSAHVSVYTLEGRLMGGIRTPYAPRPVTKAEYDAAVEEVTSAIPH